MPMLPVATSLVCDKVTLHVFFAGRGPIDTLDFVLFKTHHGGIKLTLWMETSVANIVQVEYRQCYLRPSV